MIVRDREFIQYRMERLGISVRQLASFMGYRSHTYLARVLRGKAIKVKKHQAELLATALRVPVERVFHPDPAEEDDSRPLVVCAA